jgi:hypothetical protein
MIKQLLYNRNVHTLLKGMIAKRLSKRVCPDLVSDPHCSRRCIDDSIRLRNTNTRRLLWVNTVCCQRLSTLML